MKIYLLVKSTYQSQDDDGYEFWLPEVVKCFIDYGDAMNEQLLYKDGCDEDSALYHIEEKTLVIGDNEQKTDDLKRLEVCYYTKDKLVERIVELSAECEKLEKMLRSK